MYSVKLTKIHSNHQNLRTDEIEGTTEALPVVSKSFTMIGEALTPGASFRQIITTPVMSIEVLDEGSSMVFSTMNSQYGLEYKEI